MRPLPASLHARLPLLVALAVTAAAHLPALGNGFTNWDDPGYLLFNRLTVEPLAEGIDGLLTTRSLGYPIPVTVLFYAAERAAFGLAPAGFHLVSLALHLVCVALAMALARRLGAGPRAAAAAALLFGVHPIVVEPVAWVVGQKDLLAACFLLTALLVRARNPGQLAPPNPPGDGANSLPAGPPQGAFVFALVVLAIGAKPSAVAAIAILPLLDLTLGRRPDRNAALLYAGTAVAAVGSIALGLVGHGFVGGEAPADFGARSLAHALWAVALHAGHLVWPDPLLARYFPPEGGALLAGAAAGALVLAALVSLAVIAWRRGHRQVGFSLAAALIAYAPVSGLVPLSRGTADSYLYLSLALAVMAGARGLDRLASRPRGVARAALPVVLAVLAFGLATAGQAPVWKSARSLWRPVARAYPDDPRALMRLGDAELYMGHTAAAMHAFETIAERFPDFAASLPSHAMVVESLGRTAEAEELLARAVRIDGGTVYLETYGLFLATHDLAPSDDRAARAALIAAGKLLAARGKRPSTIERAARLLRGYREEALAAALDRRVAELARRQTTEGR